MHKKGFNANLAFVVIFSTILVFGLVSASELSAFEITEDFEKVAGPAEVSEDVSLPVGILDDETSGNKAGLEVLSETPKEIQRSGSRHKDRGVGNETNSTNELPYGEFNFTPTSGMAPLEVEFNVFNYGDNDGKVVNFSWDFEGDGTFDLFTSSNVLTHLYSSGIYYPTLRIHDNDGGVTTVYPVETITVYDLDLEANVYVIDNEIFAGEETPVVFSAVGQVEEIEKFNVRLMNEDQTEIVRQCEFDTDGNFTDPMVDCSWLEIMSVFNDGSMNVVAEISSTGISAGDYFVSLSLETTANVVVADPAELTILPVLAGDLNHDGYVNAEDMAIILYLYNQAHDGEADINEDGYVNFADLNVVLSNWTG